MRGYQKQPDRIKIAHSQNSALQFCWGSKSPEPRETPRWRCPCWRPREGSRESQPRKELDNGHEALTPASPSALRHQSTSRILAGSPTSPSNLVLNPWLLSLFPVVGGRKVKQIKKFHWDIYLLSQWLYLLFKSNLKLKSTKCVVFFILH